MKRLITKQHHNLEVRKAIRQGLADATLLICEGDLRKDYDRDSVRMRMVLTRLDDAGYRIIRKPRRKRS